MKRLLAITIGGLWLLSAGMALAGPGDPLGGDDPGCVPDTKDHLKCSDSAMKAIGKAISAVWKCHIKQADLAFKGTVTDDETCENGPPGSKSAKDKLDTALAKLATVCAGTPVLANAGMIETQVFAPKTTPGSMDEQNGAVYCDGTTQIDPSGDDAGTVNTTATDAKGRQKCADTVGKSLCKLVGAVTKCHIKAADNSFKLKVFDEEACEQGPLGGKSAQEKYNTAVGDAKIGVVCTQACLSPQSTRTALGTSQIATLETYTQKLYPCGIASTTTTTTTTSTTTTIGPACCGFPGGPHQLRFENTIGSGNCGTITVSTGTLNLACGGLFFGGAGETVPLRDASNNYVGATPPDKGLSFIKITSCSGTTLTLASAAKTDPNASILTCTDPAGTCTPGGAGSCATGSCTGTGTCTGGTCTAGKKGIACVGNADCDFDCFNDDDCGVCTAGNVGLQCGKSNSHACSCLFGGPLAIPNATLPSASTCVINTIGNAQSTTVSGSADCVTGTSNSSVPLNSEVFLTGDLMLKRCNSASTNAGFNCLSTANCLGTDPTRACVADTPIQPCPICNPTTNKCNGGPNEGASCTPATSNLGRCSTAVCTSAPTTSKTCRVGTAGDCSGGETCCSLNFYPTSHDCPPPHTGGDIGGLPIAFSLTTGTASKAAFFTCASQPCGNGENVVFCPTCRDPSTGAFENPPHACAKNTDCTNGGFTVCEQRNNGAFHDATASNVSETGVAAGDLTTGAKKNSTLVSVFCIPPAYDPTLTVDNNGDLPGPGAVSLPGQAQLLP